MYIPSNAARQCKLPNLCMEEANILETLPII